MKTQDYPLRYIARMTIEFEAPFLVGGEDDFFSDVKFIADANGLPALPGSSIAGILRHEFSQTTTPDKVHNLFGYQDHDDGSGSRVTISWGCIHDSGNIPVEGILFDGKEEKDPVLRQALQSYARDHVRMTHKGTAAKSGKFDERHVSAGHRFTFEIMLEGNHADQADWESMLDILASPATGLGGKTRRGYGAFKVIALDHGIFDLTQPEGFEAFCAHPVRLSEKSTKLSAYKPKTDFSRRYVVAEMNLEPEGFWMIGGGFGTDADMNPVRETKIIWDDKTHKGTPSEALVLVPGASVKGVLSHRTAFYYNAERRIFADQIEMAESEQNTGEHNEAVRQLFGYCKEKEDDGQRGCVLIQDIYIDGETTQKILNHVSISQFTGGALTKTGALFSENPLYKSGGFPLKIIITEPEGVEKDVRCAFSRALKDLVRGGLAVGAGSGRGNGYFQAQEGIQWSDGGQWAGGEP